MSNDHLNDFSPFSKAFCHAKKAMTVLEFNIEKIYGD